MLSSQAHSPPSSSQCKELEKKEPLRQRWALRNGFWGIEGFVSGMPSFPVSCIMVLSHGHNQGYQFKRAHLRFQLNFFGGLSPLVAQKVVLPSPKITSVILRELAARPLPHIFRMVQWTHPNFLLHPAVPFLP